MTKKEKYIGAFLDGYFIKSKIEYNFKYFEQLEEAEKLANKKWKQYIKSPSNFKLTAINDKRK